MDAKRLKLIRYVSGHYDELQGLTDMAAAVVAGSIGACALVFGFPWWLVAYGLGLALGAAALTRRYYSRRFGRVRGQARLASIGSWWWVWPVMLVIGVNWDQHHVGSGLPSLTLLLWTTGPLRHVVSNWPFQAHKLLLAGAGLLAGMMFIVADSARVEEWMATSLCLVSIALFVCGWLDHRLLVHALGDCHADGGEQEAHDGAVR